MTVGPGHMTGHLGHLSKAGRDGDTLASLLAQCSLSDTTTLRPALLPCLLPQGTFRLKVREGNSRRPPGLESGSTLSKPFTLSECQHPGVSNRLAEMKQHCQAPQAARPECLYATDGGLNYKELMPGHKPHLCSDVSCTKHTR